MPFGIAALLGGQSVDLVTSGHSGALLALDVRGVYLTLGLGFHQIDTVAAFHQKVRVIEGR